MKKLFGVMAIAASFLGYLSMAEKKSAKISDGEYLVGKNSKVTLNEIYKRYGSIYGVDWKLLKAIAQVESTENPGAVGDDGTSRGLMQIHCVAPCATCNCTNNLNVLGWAEATPDKLFNPDFNVKIGVQILKWNMETYGYEKGIAVYNDWNSRKDPAHGPFRNQSYVDKVLGHLSGIAD